MKRNWQILVVAITLAFTFGFMFSRVLYLGADYQRNYESQMMQR